MCGLVVSGTRNLELRLEHPPRSDRPVKLSGRRLIISPARLKRQHAVFALSGLWSEHLRAIGALPQRGIVALERLHVRRKHGHDNEAERAVDAPQPRMPGVGGGGTPGH